MNQKTGVAAMVSIAAAIGSYIAVCSHHGVLGLILAIVAVPPRRRRVAPSRRGPKRSST